MAPTEPSDGDLLQRWRAGEVDAGRALFDRYFERLHGFFASKTSEGVEDLVQETLMACVEARDGMRRDASFPALVFGIARRRLYRRWRDERRDQDLDFSVVALQDLGPTPSSIAAQREAQRQLVQALQRVPVETQILLELFYWEGLRSPEIAQVLEIPEGTVRSRLRRARELVQEAMGPGADAADAIVWERSSD